MKIILAHYKFYLQGGPERYMFKFMELAKEKGVEIIPFSVKFPTNVPSPYSRYFTGSDQAGANFDINNHNLGYLLEGAYHDFHNRQAYRKIKALIREAKPDLLYCLIPGQLTSDIFKAAKEEGIPVIHRISDFRLLCGKYNMLRGENVCRECMMGDYRPMVKHRCVKGSKALSILRALSCDYIRRFHRYDQVDAVTTQPEYTKKQRIEALGIRDKIRFTGFVKGKALDDLTKGALCVACPAVWYENMPNVILESCAYGKPVIASNLGSLTELVEDGKTGLLFEPKNTQKIADCIRLLAEHPEKTQEMGENARKLCEEKYTPEAHWQRFLTIAESVGVHV